MDDFVDLFQRDSGKQIPASGLRSLVYGFQNPAFSLWPQASCLGQPASGLRLPASSLQPLASSLWLAASGFWPPELRDFFASREIT